MHQIIQPHLQYDQDCISLPRCHRFVAQSDTDWWSEQISRFPAQYQERCNVLVTDRIEPFQRSIRDALIDRYCPISLRTLIATSKADEDCLIRPYLGRRRRLEKNSRFQAFSLRSYPLHLDQILELSLNPMRYATIMASALATLYWRVQVDANDVEFVLASPRKTSARQNNNSDVISDVIYSQILGSHVVWLLDFDCCKHMSLDEAGVEQATRAFCRNDPFFPRPRDDDGEDESLWKHSKYMFLSMSEPILIQKGQDAHLSLLWVKKVEKFFEV